MTGMPEHAHRHAEHRTETRRHWSKDGATTHDGVEPAKCAICTPEPDPWCRREDCTWRHWRSGGVPTHRRGDDCPPPEPEEA